MVVQELKKHFEKLSKEELLDLCIGLLSEQINQAAKLSTFLAKMDYLKGGKNAQTS